MTLFFYHCCLLLVHRTESGGKKKNRAQMNQINLIKGIEYANAKMDKKRIVIIHRVMSDKKSEQNEKKRK